MDRLGRNPALPIGFVLLVLGAGNWIVSANRITEYASRVTPVGGSAHAGQLEDFPELSPRTNETLLKRLNRGYVNYSVVDAKLDFYEVVASGGRVLSLIGMLLITAALVQGWRSRGTT